MLKASFANNYGMLEKAIDACPDSAWIQKCGKLVFWQQAAHAFAAIDFFVRGKDDAPLDLGVRPEILDMKNIDATPLTRAEMKALINKMMAHGVNYFDSLKDEDLTKKLEGFSSRRGMDITVLAGINILISHTMYHLAICDSVLRDNNLPGIM
jgi:hypothetical protein